MSLAGLWTTMAALPLPVVVGAGIVLAIASNRTIRIRRFVPDSLRTGKSMQAGDRPQSSSQNTGIPHSAHQTQEPQLPQINPQGSPQSSRSISFKIHSTNDSTIGIKN